MKLYEKVKKFFYYLLIIVTSPIWLVLVLLVFILMLVLFSSLPKDFWVNYDEHLTMEEEIFEFQRRDK